MSKTNILEQLDRLTEEMGDISALVEKTEVFRSFNRWLSERHTDGNIVCEINQYDDLLSIDCEGTIIKADSLLQIRYNDKNRRKRGARKVDEAGSGNTVGDHN